MPEQDQPPKKAAAKKAAPQKATAKKAPTKAPATKAAAKKGTARKAAPGTPRDAILSRIAELEERISAEPPRKALPAEELAAQAPQKPVAVKRPAPRKPAPAPVRRPVTKAVTPAPVEVEAPEPVAPELEGPPPVPAPPAQETVLPPAAVVDEPARPAAEPEERPAAPWRPLVAAAVVVLLTVAVGLGAAALARSQPATWSSSSVVTLSAVSPGASASAVPGGVDRYQERAQSSSFTAVSLFQAGLKQSDLRSLVKARDGGPGQVVLQAKASSKAGAAKLAAAAGRALVMAVTASEAQVADQDERLAATSTLASDPRRETPSNRDVWLAGLLAAVACLLVTTLVALLRTGRNFSRDPARGSRT